MSVDINIKLGGNTISVAQIAGIMDLAYGISDDNYVLRQGEIGTWTVLYDPRYIGRGVEVRIDEDEVCMRISLPATQRELYMFYDLAAAICRDFGIAGFEKDGVYLPVDDAYAFLEADVDAGVEAIKQISENIRNKEYSQFYVFGALNPITLGESEINEIDGSIHNFGQLLNRLQQTDAFYAAPRYYRKNDYSIFGVYFVGQDIVTIVPEKPANPFCKVGNVSSWYAFMAENVIVEYDVFIKHVNIIGRYDNDHVIVCIDSEKVAELAQFAVDV